MSDLAAAVEDYLGLRRSLGFALRDQDRLLAGFVAYLDTAGLDTVTTEAALALGDPARQRRSLLARQAPRLRAALRRLPARLG